MLIWRIAGQEPLFVHAQITNGTGAFSLQRSMQDGTSAPIGNRIDPPGAGGLAIFEIPAAEFAGLQNLNLQLGILGGNPAQAAMSVFLKVDQASGPLTPVDALGNDLPTQANGVRLNPGLSHNVQGYWPFQVDFS